VTIERQVLLTETLSTPVPVAAVESQRITFGPGQRSPRHSHPCPVVGLVLEGEFVYRIDGQGEVVLRAGDAFLEPAGAVVVRFDNASPSAPGVFLAQYLLSGPGEPTVTVLDG
jgi:quercetin dioxygenase-like cupin family protein